MAQEYISTSRNALFTLLNNDESTPGRECGLVQPIKEESAIIDSQDSSEDKIS